MVKFKKEYTNSFINNKKYFFFSELEKYRDLLKVYKTNCYFIFDDIQFKKLNIKSNKIKVISLKKFNRFLSLKKNFLEFECGTSFYKINNLLKKKKIKINFNYLNYNEKSFFQLLADDIACSNANEIKIILDKIKFIKIIKNNQIVKITKKKQILKKLNQKKLILTFGIKIN